MAAETQTFRVSSRFRGVAFAAALFALLGTGALGSGCDAEAPMGENDESTGTAGDLDPVDDGLLELGLFAEARRFVPYRSGDEEVVELGLQGGYHIFVDGRLRPDADLAEVVVELVVTRLDDDAEVTRIRHQRVPDIPDADGWPTLPEMIIFIPEPGQVYGLDVRVDVAVWGLDGVLLDVLDAQLHLVAESD